MSRGCWAVAARWLAALAGLCAAGGLSPVWAQAAAGLESDAAARVVERLEARDCPGAVRTLNEALPGGDPAVLVLAGAMFEDGICLKAQWDRAVRLYTRASEAGSALARWRLAAGYGSALGGPDIGLALWWSHRAETLPAACRVTGFAETMDAERFVAAVNAWPSGQAAACAWVGAVWAGLNADARYDASLQRLKAVGRVRVTFDPATGRFAAEELEASADRREWQAGEDDPSRLATLIGAVQAFSARAVRKAVRPQAVPDGLRHSAEFVFRLR